MKRATNCLSRMAWHFVPSFRIFLNVDLHEAAKRIFANPRPDEKKTASIEETYKNILARQKNDAARYKKWYGVDFLKLENYDVVIDTTKLSQEEVLKKVVEAVKQKKKQTDSCADCCC